MSLLVRDEMIDAIKAERLSQDLKWGPSEDRPVPPLAVLIEEVGEVANAILEQDTSNLMVELVQVAAVAVAMLEGICRGDVPA